MWTDIYIAFTSPASASPLSFRLRYLPDISTWMSEKDHQFTMPRTELLYSLIQTWSTSRDSHLIISPLIRLFKSKPKNPLRRLSLIHISNTSMLIVFILKNIHIELDNSPLCALLSLWSRLPSSHLLRDLLLTLLLVSLISTLAQTLVFSK